MIPSYEHNCIILCIKCHMDGTLNVHGQIDSRLSHNLPNIPSNYPLVFCLKRAKLRAGSGDLWEYEEEVFYSVVWMVLKDMKGDENITIQHPYHHHKDPLKEQR